MPEKKVTFEQSLQKLEEIVHTLEGDISIDEAIKLFEDGIELSKKCVEELKAEKGKLSILTNEIKNLTEELSLD